MSLRIGFAALLIGALAISPAVADDLPKSTVKMMQEKKLDLKLLDGLDKELAMPQAWIDGAKKEKVLRVGGTWENVGWFNTRAEALAWIRANIGACDDEGNLSLLTEIAEDEDATPPGPVE